jgi:hypothetical protein
MRRSFRSPEHHRLLPVEHHPVLSVPTHRSRQDHALHVAAELDQLVGRESVVDADHVLLDDRALVEILGNVVGGGADQLKTGPTKW